MLNNLAVACWWEKYPNFYHYDPREDEDEEEEEDGAYEPLDLNKKNTI